MKYTCNTLLLGVSLLCNSCNQLADLNEPKEPIPIHFSVEIANTVAGDHPKSTRMILNKSTFVAGAQIAVFLTKDPSVVETTPYIKTAFYQLALSGTTQTWSAARGTGTLSLYQQDANLYALYPHDATFSSPTEVAPDTAPTLTLTHLASKNLKDLSAYTLSTGSVPINETLVKIDATEVDYLAGKGAATLTPNAPSTTVTMNHMMAMLAIHLTKDVSYLSPGLLTEFTIKNASTGNKPLKSGTVDLVTGVFTPSSIEATYHRTFTNHQLDDNVGLLVYPATCGVGDLAISLTVDGEVYDIKNEVEITFAPGVLTVLSLNVMADKLFINNTILINDWPSIAEEHPFELE